ncbi:DEAD/DEAH box helicase [Chitinophaga sp.]|uniref:DEAD/DEAH box helicase n=1 Tax=Chitinophaga sp. TaxID=1869181 RepID=UPI0031DF08CA
MLKFENFVTRLNEEIIQKIVGRSAIQILNSLNTDLTRISRLQNVLLNIYSPIELLQQREIRNELIDILKESEAKNLCSLLKKSVENDVYSTLKSVKFNSENDRSKLLEFFEIVIEDIPNEYQFVPVKYAEANYSLFKHQRKAIRELNHKLYNDGKKVMLHMPTGSGKTRTAMNVICNHYRIHEPTVVIWLAHTEELCEQATMEFERAWKNLGNRELKVVRYWGNSSEKISDLKDAFIVGGLTKVFNLLKTDVAEISKLASHCSLVVMDEAHMAIAPTFKLNLHVLTSFNSSLLGLSATPGRTWNDPNADLELSKFFNRQKVTLQIEGYPNPVDYLTAEGYLAKVQNVPLFYQSGFKISDKDLEYLKNNFQLSDSFLKKLSEDQQRNILILKKVDELITRHKRIILFAMNVEHSNLLATCLQARGINAFSITSSTASDQRKRLIDRFISDGEIPLVLCNYGILTTGFDAPKTSCALITRPTDSLVLYSQMVGRAIRGTKAGGNETAEIVTVVDSSLPGFDAVANAFFNWEDVW